MRLPAACARARAFAARSMGAGAALVSGAACLPAFLLQRNAALLALETALFFVCALIRRGSARLAPSLLLIASVTFFSALTPFGRVLFTVAGFPVTAGALAGGFRRACVLCGMVFLSQAALGAEAPPSLPGKAGGFIAAVSAAFAALTAERLPPPRAARSFSLAAFIDGIDARLMAADAAPAAGSAPRAAETRARAATASGAALLAALPAALYALLALGSR